METKERWQEVEYPHYMTKGEPLTCFVSDKGRVKLPQRVIKSKGNSTRMQKERMAKLYKPNKTYGYIRCCAGLVHRLVAHAFVEKPVDWEDSKLWTVNHIDGNKQNNHWTNLEWVRHQENCVKYYDSDKAIGIRNKPVIVHRKDDDSYVGVYPSCTHLAKELGLHKSAITMILGGRIKSTGGYKVKEITPKEYHALSKTHTSN